ncbi:MAG: ParA family protein [Clostridia bacterium]|nr:ParA family protein [Oscillospiraceae bacterium]MCI6973560.1 ParA family protein [Clostridiales bacterium]MDO4353367.1 ParA family protein [Clostridia bacterium]MDY2909754.1 ParA family protein [Oscillospiraceae bacterium]
MSKIIAIANQKGGVGKTTTAVNLCCALKMKGKRVLLLDCDPQGNSSSGMGVDKHSTPSAYELITKTADILDCIRKTPYGDVIPSNKELSGATVELVNKVRREYVLKDALQLVYNDYDYIFIDCPPSLELLTLNALVAADSVLIPMQCEYYALEGIADLMTTIKLCNKRLNPSLKIQGIVLTMYDSRTNLTQQVAFELKEYFGGKVYETVIPRSVRLSEAPSHGKPGVAYDKIGKGSRAYMRLAEEFLKKERR